MVLQINHRRTTTAAEKKNNYRSQNVVAFELLLYSGASKQLDANRKLLTIVMRQECCSVDRDSSFMKGRAITRRKTGATARSFDLTFTILM
ncbi:hypothetical protein ILYODFUR_034716 [Ilyodon furcidens]|uniref:Uncharacterized protein n=1 Tax=Ilyodon furcidens TaxID=33524 RepID=A0ABV0UMY2_9TELE